MRIIILSPVQGAEPDGETERWTGAIGNIEDARVALDTLAHAIDDAVYLDEDAYNQVAPVMQYQKTIQVTHVPPVLTLTISMRCTPACPHWLAGAAAAHGRTYT